MKTNLNINKTNVILNGCEGSKSTCHTQSNQCHTRPDRVSMDSRIKSENDEMETGRSMVEMLGVLAVIGGLSIGGIAGYNTAMNKHRANDILNAASQRAMVVSAQIQRDASATPSLAEFSTAEVQGTYIQSATKVGDNQFKLAFQSDKKPATEICKQMLNIAGDGSTGNVRIDSGCTRLLYNIDLSPNVADTNNKTNGTCNAGYTGVDCDSCDTASGYESDGNGGCTLTAEDNCPTGTTMMSDYVGPDPYGNGKCLYTSNSNLKCENGTLYFNKGSSWIEVSQTNIKCQANNVIQACAIGEYKCVGEVYKYCGSSGLTTAEGIYCQNGVAYSSSTQEEVICLNGGIKNGTVCECSTGFSGDRCQYHLINCQNGGYWTGTKCQCTDSSFGTECELMFEALEI